MRFFIEIVLKLGLNLEVLCSNGRGQMTSAMKNLARKISMKSIKLFKKAKSRQFVGFYAGVPQNFVCFTIS